MLKLKFAAVGAAALLVGLMSASGAQAAYEDPPIQITFSDSSPVEGDSFSVSASSGNIDCDWSTTFNGVEDNDSGTETSSTFTAPTVDQDTDFPLTITCVYDDEAAPISATVNTNPSAVTEALFVPTAIQTVSRTVNVTVLSSESGDGDGSGNGDGNAALPGTGGSSQSLIWIGAGLLLAGAGVTFAARRRVNRT